MINQKISRFKPLYKQFVNLRENAQNRKKLLKFKRKKWEKFIGYCNSKLKRYRKFKLQDQLRYAVTEFANKWISYKRRFKPILNSSRNFRLFYGNLSKNFVKKQIRQTFNKKINKTKNFKLIFLNFFEQRLDTILYRSKFCISLRNARQLIVHGKIFINKTPAKIPSYKLKPGDLISVDTKHHELIEKNVKSSQIWPMPPKYLFINYKTLEILFGGNIKYTNLSTNFTFYLNLEKILSSYLKR